MKELTLTQSEGLKIGRRGAYVPRVASVRQAADHLGITCWVEKREPKPMDAAERTLRQMVDMGDRYELMYGITFSGDDYECGDQPRDIGGTIRGIAITRGLVLPMK
jgi:hypothetical protein